MSVNCRNVEYSQSKRNFLTSGVQLNRTANVCRLRIQMLKTIIAFGEVVARRCMEFEACQACLGITSTSVSPFMC